VYKISPIKLTYLHKYQAFILSNNQLSSSEADKKSY